MLKSIAAGGIVAAMLASGASDGRACTRVVYSGADSIRIVGRTLDWRTPIPTNIYVYPRGMAKQGSAKAGSVCWTSRYGAVYAVGYDSGVTEGMNEKGLVVNGLFCKDTQYTNDSTAGRAAMSLAVFVAWILDMNATTAEAVEMLRSTPFSIIGSTFDGGTATALHWGITDARGHTALLEFDGGEMHIYEADTLDVLANDPPYPQMAAINGYWRKVGGVNMLPGAVRSADRFVRASFFNRHVERTEDPDMAVTITRSLMANVAVPYHYTIETEPNVSSTQWRSYSDIGRRRYYFDVATALGLYYIDLTRCNLAPGAPVMKLDTSRAGAIVGEANGAMEAAAPFTPLY